MNDQRSTTEQLKDIYVLAVKAGHYDGANCILNIIGEGFVEQNPSAKAGSTGDDGLLECGSKNWGDALFILKTIHHNLIKDNIYPVDEFSPIAAELKKAIEKLGGEIF